MRAALHFLGAVIFGAAVACQPIQIGSSGEPDSLPDAPQAGAGGVAHAAGGRPGGGAGGNRPIQSGGSAGTGAGAGGMSAVAGGGTGGEAPSCTGDRLKVSGRVTSPIGAPL